MYMRLLEKRKKNENWKIDIININVDKKNDMQRMRNSYITLVP